ncbi:hypothetical protein GcM3_202038 [Golovinomyces cichoracearum]|uniref:Uncharacterized protein n=1 Tax=Golovinomyces cichoracearum TaxID=62708 RepID=A0A420HD20_9PEZI|nr:hypothetical protein GcM3_202038 [Golovinomyces cichoracearum]
MDGYIKHNFIGEQLWEAFVDDFEDYKTQQDWQLGDKATIRAFRDMLRARGVYLPKERGANTILKHLANFVNSAFFPDWDKYDRDYKRFVSLLEFSSIFMRDVANLRISGDTNNFDTPAVSQQSQRAMDKAPVYDDGSN